MIGTTISHYRIIEKLGEGGMGVVYKAHDTKLDRDVALKFLPHHLTATVDEQARFLQEARAASALNHPNICTIHAIEGQDDQQFIVMEYIEGGTLREKLPYAKIDDALSVALQIGEALQEAHVKGIVHRDIKADNIMLTSKGQAKVMDFGLAKLKGSLKLTKTSSTLGTLAYMAPEQIRGGEVDARSDIFSFGVVLYEMLTGHLPFRGEHEAAVMYSIVNEPALPVERYLPDVSAELVHVLNRALEKDPDERYQTVHDMVIDLRRLKKETSRVSRNIDYSQTSASSAENNRKRRKVKMFLWLGGGAIIVATAAVALLLLQPARVSLNPNFTIRTLYTCTYQAPTYYVTNPFFVYPGLSRDGNWVSFGAIGENGLSDLFFMNVTWREPRKISWGKGNPAGALVSPTGDQILFGGLGTWLHVVSTNGGDVQQVTDEITSGGDWSIDGNRINFLKRVQSPSPRLELWSMRKDGTEKRMEWFDPLPPQGALNQAFAWSPDGESIAWIRNFSGGYTELFTRNMKTGVERQLTFDKKIADEPSWLTSGVIVFMSNRSGVNNIWAMPATGGEARIVTAGAGEVYSASISGDGKRMLVPQVDATTEIWTTDLSGADTKKIKLDFYALPNFAVSDDLQRFAFIRREPSNKWGIYTTDNEGKNRVRLIVTDHHPYCPVFSPDGRWIAFCESQESTGSVSVIASDKPGPAKVITPPNIPSSTCWVSSKEMMIFTPDRRSFICQAEGGAVRQFFEDSTWAVPVAGGNLICYSDFRAGKRGFYYIRADAQGKVSGKETKLSPFSTVYAVSPDLRTWIYSKRPGERWRMTLPAATEERIGEMPPLVGWDKRINNGGTKIFYRVDDVTLKLVLYENLFE